MVWVKQGSLYDHHQVLPFAGSSYFHCSNYFLSTHWAGRVYGNDSFTGSPVTFKCFELIDKWIASCLPCSSHVKHNWRASTQAGTAIVPSYQTAIRQFASRLSTFDMASISLCQRIEAVWRKTCRLALWVMFLLISSSHPYCGCTFTFLLFFLLYV